MWPDFFRRCRKRQKKFVAEKQKNIFSLDEGFSNWSESRDFVGDDISPTAALCQPAHALNAAITISFSGLGCQLRVDTYVVIRLQASKDT